MDTGSTAMGASTTASGICFYSNGARDTDSKWKLASTAMGSATTASDYGSLVIGQYNSSGSSATSANSFSTANTAFVIGNGVDSSNISDAFSILFDGTTNIAGSVTADSFIKDGGVSTEFLKADGSVDSSVYITAAEVTPQADSDWASTVSPTQILNKPTTISTQQADEITANTLKRSYPVLDEDKLATIETGAQVNVQSDWDATTGDALILNKPVITDDQAISYNTSTNVVSLEDGGTIDLSLLNNSGTDDQALSLTGNTLDLEDGGSVNLDGYLDNTDDQAISYNTSTNVVSLEDGGTIDLSLLNNSGTDDQALSLTGNTLDLEDGGSVNLDGYLDNTDDQAISYNTSTNVISLEDGGTIDLSLLNNSGTDDQALSLTGNTLDLEDGGSVNLDGYLDNTDDQAISYNTSTNVISLEDGGTIDLSLLNNSGTDDQALSLTGNTLDLEDGGSVNLAGYLDNTDDQQLGNFILSAGSLLSLSIERGNGVSVNLAPLLADLEAENDDQNTMRITSIVSDHTILNCKI